MPSELVEHVLEQLSRTTKAQPLLEDIVPVFPHELRSQTEESLTNLQAKSMVTVDKHVALSVVSHLLACADRDAITNGEVQQLRRALDGSSLTAGQILALAAVQSASLNLMKKADAGWPIKETWIPTVDIGDLPTNDDLQGLERLETKVRQIAAYYGTELAYETGFYLSAENVAVKISADMEKTWHGAGPVCEEPKPYWAALSMLERTDNGRPFAWKGTLPSSTVQIKLENPLDPEIRYESVYALNSISGALRKLPVGDAETGPLIDIIIGAEAHNHPTSDIVLRLSEGEAEGTMDLDYVLKGARGTLKRTTNALTANCALLWSWTRLSGGGLNSISEDENRRLLLARHVASTCKSENTDAVHTAHHLLDGGEDESFMMELRPEFPAYKAGEALNTLRPVSRSKDRAVLNALREAGISFDDQVDSLYDASWKLRLSAREMSELIEAYNRERNEGTEDDMESRLELPHRNLKGPSKKLKAGLTEYEGTLRSLLGPDRQDVLDERDSDTD